MNIEQFNQHAQALHQSLADLYQTASVLPWISPDLLPEAFKELYRNSKMVQLAAEELYEQNEELIQTRNQLEVERQHYQDLFEFAPDGYLVTNAEGIIQEANKSAAKFFNVPKHFLLGKPMIQLIHLEDQQCFRNTINQLSQANDIKELVLHLQQLNGEPFNAALTVGVVRNQHGRVDSLHWLLRNINERQQTELLSVNTNSDLTQDRPVYQYTKGETIPLNPLIVWYVCQGLVKLSTFCETGEEVLIGLATTQMVFGSNMTSLPIYQATALSDVEIVSIYVPEIAVTPLLSHTLLPKINQRLQQTESFLVIAGRRRVEDRLNHLLQLLKREVGEPFVGGTRLNVRLTHEDIANACCTTRVTITRLMGKLQQQGLICFDSKKHIILKDEMSHSC